jgi:Protein kinase domain/NACHT domain
MEFCPVCMLRKGLAGGIESGESSASEDPLKPTAGQLAQRFEHYELVQGEDGKPVELGRGAMGVTYKAFDVDLHCSVTLKVISEKYLNDESARLRFLREARAAASVRDANVASVFHLGRSGEDYFYAMEFVEGETLANLIKRSVRLEVKLALEIATQVAAGLAAVHKQKLVHRDIKPSNIMVRLEEGGAVTAKIIDLGLAKAAATASSEVDLTRGGFVGTPGFASPEQFAGVGVDIRSDLYSLGVVLWEMVTGHAVFKGSPAEVMYQQQHAPLPLDLLEAVPQPVVVLLEVLLEKDPAQRFQNPCDLLKAMPAIKGALDDGIPITRESVQEISPSGSFGVRRKLPVRPWPDRISLARLPVTGRDVFGRQEDLTFLDAAWANSQVNVVSVVAWAGVGKSTLVNHWLRGLAADQYRSADLVFGWSFYRQGTSGVPSSADEFLDAALVWFGDPDPRVGTAWEKGERLANLVAHRRTLLILDGLEPLQNPPGSQEGRLRDPSLQALLRELAALNAGLCVITTRLAVADLAQREGSSALRLDLEHLSSVAGEQLLRALEVKGQESELRGASEEFGGHCLALTLLGSYLSDAYNGDIRRHEEVASRLAHDVRQGAHARKVMNSYQSWFGEGPELSLLLLLGLFDRPAAEEAIGTLLKPPFILGLTECLMELSPRVWRPILARLRRARLLAPEDPSQPGQLDTHPLVREYFGDQLRSRSSEAWKECNRRLYDHYRALASPLPESITEMEPLFLAVICGCQAGLLRDTLHEVYLPRIQRGNVSFAANVLGIRGALLSALAAFFEQGRWGTFAQTEVEGQHLVAEDQLFILTQAGLYLTATRGFAASEVRSCYERAEPLCHSLDRPLLLYAVLTSQWRYSLATDKMNVAMGIAKRIYSLADGLHDDALMVGAHRALATTLFYKGDFQLGLQHARHGVQIWREGGIPSLVEEVHAPAILCLSFGAMCEWMLGEVASAEAMMTEALSLGKRLNDTHALAMTLILAGALRRFENNPTGTERCASDLIELSTRHSFASWLAAGEILHGWVRCVSGYTAVGVLRIEEGITAWQATGSTFVVPFWLALKAEALYLANRTPEAFAAINEAEELAEKLGERVYCAELHRLHGVFLTALGAAETEIEASFRAAISTAREQKSISLEKRAEGTYAEYRRQKGSRLGGRAFRLPL